ncbi:hypothetical protein C8R45DRAFT_1115388 [Mycena sanguinolenta]|nr:hypothetical protein C8R45DRAFT_1115388 [Mycena sanguinolenta]
MALLPYLPCLRSLPFPPFAIVLVAPANVYADPAWPAVSPSPARARLELEAAQYESKLAASLLYTLTPVPVCKPRASILPIRDRASRTDVAADFLPRRDDIHIHRIRQRYTRSRSQQAFSILYVLAGTQRACTTAGGVPLAAGVYDDDDGGAALRGGIAGGENLGGAWLLLWGAMSLGSRHASPPRLPCLALVRQHFGIWPWMSLRTVFRAPCAVVSIHPRGPYVAVVVLTVLVSSRRRRSGLEAARRCRKRGRGIT